MTSRDYQGPSLDCTMTPITERPELEGVVYVTEPEGQGTETTENVPMPGEDDDDPVRIPGQSTLTEWGGSE